MAFSVPILIVTSLLSIVGVGCLVQDCLHKTKDTRKTSNFLAKAKEKDLREHVYERGWESADRKRISEVLGRLRNPGSMADARSMDSSLHSSNRVSFYEPSLWDSEKWRENSCTSRLSDGL